MEVCKLIDNKKFKGYMVKVNKDEAVQLIHSLSEQIINKDPNVGRTEFNTIKGEYFSIAVHKEEASEKPINDYSFQNHILIGIINRLKNIAERPLTQTEQSILREAEQATFKAAEQ